MTNQNWPMIRHMSDVLSLEQGGMMMQSGYDMGVSHAIADMRRNLGAALAKAAQDHGIELGGAALQILTDAASDAMGGKA
ncbi:MAG: hypothetical protein JWP08_1918 [Bryobacterales bacterium]|nr:hypothetical protein [Bryobacterales bacterium]